MLMKIAHHNDGKEKWQSHNCYLFNNADDYHEFDITNIHMHWKRCFTKQMCLTMTLLKLIV